MAIGSRLCLSVAAALAVLAGPALAAPGQTLKDVRARGVLVCGVSSGVLGFSSTDEKGETTGFDADFCRAVAAAVLGDGSKVRFVPLSAAARFDALKSGQVDLLARNSTWTMGREIELGLLFTGVTYYDGQGFLLAKARNATSALELTDLKICVQDGTTTEQNLADFFSANGMAFTPVKVTNPDEARAAYEKGACDVITSDLSQLYGERLKLGTPFDHMVLPDVISKEPLGPVVRNDDVQWFDIVKWVGNSLVNAEELGVTSRNIDDARKSRRPDVRRLVGIEEDFGQPLGLDKAWAANAIQAVGNYGEVFERNVGSRSRLAIPRGINQLWLFGGILYAPPIR
jgi:general L-amino acid transport system substrate-binding protein